MRLAVYRCPALALKIGRIVGDMFVVDVCPDLAALALALRTRPVDALALDLGAPRDGDEGVTRLVARYPSLPLVLCSATDQGVQRVLGGMALRAPVVALRDVDDSPNHLRTFLESIPPVSLTGSFLQRCRPLLETIPPSLAGAIAAHLVQAEPSRSVQWIAASAGLSRRSVERWIIRAGFTSARRLAITPIVCRAYCYLRDRGYTIGDVATKIGVSSRHTMLEELFTLLRTRSVAAIRQLSPGDFLDQITTSVISRPATTGTSGAPRRSCIG